MIMLSTFVQSWKGFLSFLKSHDFLKNDITSTSLLFAGQSTPPDDLLANFKDHRSYRSGDVNLYTNTNMNNSEKAKLTTLIRHIEKFSNIYLDIRNPGIVLTRKGNERQLQSVMVYLKTQKTYKVHMVDNSHNSQSILHLFNHIFKHNFRDTLKTSNLNEKSCNLT